MSDATLLVPTMLLYSLFFADRWEFRQLPFEEGITKSGLIPELARQMGFLTGDIVGILVVGISRFSSGTQPEHLCHRYLVAS